MIHSNSLIYREKINLENKSLLSFGICLTEAINNLICLCFVLLDNVIQEGTS